MPNTTITQWGLDYASSASPVGTLIAPLYWVPVYDSRIDGLIHDSVLPVSAFSACVNVSATAPTGEIIWNVDGVTDRYTMSDNNKVFILSGSDTSLASSQLIDNPIQSQQWQINELNGVPLAPHFSATEAYFTPANIKWNTSAAFAATPWDNTPVLSGKDKYFQVIDYYPVSADTEDSKLRGMVKCRLAKDIGTVKFNKVALYINKFNSLGEESPDEPVFFAECQLKTTVIKTSMGTNGFDDVTVDVQIDLHSISADWNDVFFSTSGDYWSRVPDGIYYPERVGIGSFIDSVLSPQASLHVRRTRAMVSLGITDAPVARFDFDDTNYHEIDVSDTGLVHETFNSDYGNFGLNFQPAYKIIYPDTTGVGLGINSSRFRSIYLDTDGIDIYDSSSYGYIKENFVDNRGYINSTDNVSMSFYPIGYDAAVALISYIEGADIRRKDKLINYTINDASDYLIISDINESDSIWGDYYSPLPTSQYGVTHNNILYALDDPSYVDWIGTSGKVKIYGRGEIDLNGPVMLDAYVYTGGGTTPYPFGALMSRKAKVLMAAGLTTDPYNIIVQALAADAAENPSNEWNNIATGMTSSGEYQIVGRIRHSEDLRPLIADKSVIGVPALTDLTGTIPTQTAVLYKRLHIGILGAYKGETFDGSNLYADDRISTIYAKDIGTTEEINGWSRIHRIAMYGLLNCGYLQTGFDLGWITNDPDVGNPAYPQNGTAYPTGATHPTYYGLWPKTYVVLGNKSNMLASLGHSNPYLAGYSTIDLICTRYLSLTNTLKFEEAFDILGKYRTIPFGYYPGLDPSTYANSTSYSSSVEMPGIHKTGSVGVTLGDEVTSLDSAYISAIYAGSLTLTGALLVGSVVTTGDVTAGGNISVGKELIPAGTNGLVNTEVGTGLYANEYRLILGRQSNIYIIPITTSATGIPASGKISAILSDNFKIGQRIILAIPTSTSTGIQIKIMHNRIHPATGTNIKFYTNTHGDLTVTTMAGYQTSYEFCFDGTYWVQM